MAPQPPQTISVKRKRNETPVQSLVVEHPAEPAEHTVEHPVKRHKGKSEYTWVLQPASGVHVPAPGPSPAQPNRRFHVLSKGQRVLVEAPSQPVAEGPRASAPDTPVVELAAPAAPTPSRPRKRPGASSAVRAPKPATENHDSSVAAPSEEHVRQFQQFSQEIEQSEHKPPATPLKYMPTGPGRRIKGRSGSMAEAQDADAMDLDDYVYDTYVRELVIPDADGKLPEHSGTVGIIVLNEEDEEWWNGNDESDKEFDTDDEDENAEDYYANDYPEDEMSSDDEFDRNLYQSKYRHGEDDEEYDLDDYEEEKDDEDDEDARSGDDDDEHFRRLPAPSQAAYWKRFEAQLSK